MASDLLLKLKSIDKHFPGVRALDGVDFNLRAGEVHVLLGQNGAGKSTLMKILSGLYAPDGGTITCRGRSLNRFDPALATQNGIAMVHQELCLVPNLSVAENVLLGAMPRRHGVIQWTRAEERAAELLTRLGVSIDVRRPVCELEVAEQQLVEIARALALDPKIMLLDEPTSALSDAERSRLFSVIRTLKASGVGLIYISHHLAEVPVIGDRVTVLRDGRVAGSLEATEATEEVLVELMVGRAIAEREIREVSRARGSVALETSGLTLNQAFSAIDLRLHFGEILGVFGLMGAGQAELARVLFGLDTADAGTIAIESETVQMKSPADAIARGVALIARDRRESLVPMFATGPNLSLPWIADVWPSSLLKLKREAKETKRYIDRLNIEPPLPEREVMFFSGGNQQKVVLARWMSSGSNILIFDEPARGIDVGAKAEVFGLMSEMARNNAAILMISSEPAEIESMADRALVFRKGEIACQLSGTEITQQRLLQEAG